MGWPLAIELVWEWRAHPDLVVIEQEIKEVTKRHNPFLKELGLSLLS